MRGAVGKFVAVLACWVAGAFSAENAPVPVAAAPEDSIPSLDLLVATMDSVQVDSATTNSVSVDSSANSSLADTSALQVPPAEKNAAVDSAAVAAPLKTVLYLGGGERSPWFHLGVLYAIEEYAIPVDSVVGTSWGAWIGNLWTKGVPLDDIQKMMLDSTIAPFVGHDLSAEANFPSQPRLGYQRDDSFDVPVSVSGKPAIRQRYVLSLDSQRALNWNKKSLLPDSMQVVRALAKLRLQESLYRVRSDFRIPFAVQSCDAGNPVVVGNTVPQVIASLPLWQDDAAKEPAALSGELCPYYAMPVEDKAEELSIIVASDPLRAPLTGSASVQLLKRHAMDVMSSQPGVVIRAHTILDTSRAAWIQSGFTSFEKQLARFKVLNGRRGEYASERHGAKPWFRFEPSFEALSPETQSAVKSYWDESDTGIVAPERFGLSLLQKPTYDSLEMDMLPSGNVSLESSVHPVLDLAAGGFGSSAIGPNAYFDASMYYVDHVEIELVLAGFWGGNSYGFQPRLNISKLWNRHWDLMFGYDYLNLVPLKSFNNNISRSLRVLSEERSDLLMDLGYSVDSHQRISAEFIFGSRTFEMDSIYYGDRGLKTYPVSPMLHYRYLEGADDNWFAENGHVLNIWGGFESIGYDDGIIDVVPIYWKLLADARYTVSPSPYTSFTVAAAGAIERYHDEGHGYVSPKSFDFRPVDVAYRQHAVATPWSTEWYNAELSSHEYVLVRTNGGLHGRYAGAWLFAAYYHDFEDSPFAELAVDKFVLEPALRLAYRSFVLYAGMNRIVDKDSFGDLWRLKQYSYFVRIGNYEF